MDVALSNKDISKFFNNKVKIVTYDQLDDFKSIDDLLYPYNKVILLYFWAVEPRIGHWTCLFKTPKNTIEFFNSFGSVPDKTLNQIPISFKKQHGEDFNTLTQMLFDSDYDIEYNDKCFQSDDSATCGRYCILRLCCKDIPIEQFQKLFTKNKLKNDKLVVDLIQ